MCRNHHHHQLTFIVTVWWVLERKKTNINWSRLFSLPLLTQQTRCRFQSPAASVLPVRARTPNNSGLHQTCSTQPQWPEPPEPRCPAPAAEVGNAELSGHGKHQHPPPSAPLPVGRRRLSPDDITCWGGNASLTAASSDARTYGKQSTHIICPIYFWQVYVVISTHVVHHLCQRDNSHITGGSQLPSLHELGEHCNHLRIA